MGQVLREVPGKVAFKLRSVRWIGFSWVKQEDRKAQEKSLQIERQHDSMQDSQYVEVRTQTTVFMAADYPMVVEDRYRQALKW